ncbi:hypothetical protein M3Y96_00089500 [Aphelenchoides besseyi]|nr:hypothetical protein M3Y96_00089500 [Aphelenchoides besseyi]
MPLLSGSVPFERVPLPYVRPKTLVYHIKESGEAFVNFNDMTNRLQLIQANCWTCAVTGRNNLTLSEAFESEKTAHKGFPDYGKRPILFLAWSYFQGHSFTDLVLGLYRLIKDRYFLNEWVKYHVGAKFTMAKIISIEQIANDNETTSDIDVLPAATSFRYVVEFYDSVKGCNVRVNVSDEEISRLQTYSSRNALQNYFTEITERDSNGQLTFKEDELERLEVKNLEWSDVFVGSAPNLEMRKKKKGRPPGAESAKITETNDLNSLKSNEPTEWEKYKTVEKEVRKARLALAERRLKLWNDLELREDLELNNLKALPQLQTLDLPIEPPEFAKLLAVYGFMKYFRACLPAIDENISIFHLFRAVLSHEGKELFSNLVCELVRTRNARIEVEDYDEADINDEREIPEYHRNELLGPFSEEIEKRNLRMEEIRKKHGASLSALPVTKHNISEMLLLALETAGYVPQAVAQNERRKFRGDLLCSEDDLFQFSLKHPEIVAHLRKATIHDLSPSQKIEVLNALMTNLVTYGPFREATGENDLVDLHRTNYRILKLFYLEQQYQSDYMDTIELMDVKFPNFQFKRNGHSKKVEMSIEQYVADPNVEDAINLCLMKTRFDYVQPRNRQVLREVQKNAIDLRVRGMAEELLQIYDKMICVPMGMDRAFRSYLYLVDQRILLVEGPIDELKYKCTVSDQTDSNEGLVYPSCNGAENSCPIHSISTPYKWSIVSSYESFLMLMSGLDARGRREATLLANLKSCANEIRRGFLTMSDFLNSFVESLQIINENETVGEREKKHKPQNLRSPSVRAKRPRVLGDDFVRT